MAKLRGSLPFKLIIWCLVLAMTFLSCLCAIHMAVSLSSISYESFYATPEFSQALHARVDQLSSLISATEAMNAVDQEENGDKTSVLPGELRRYEVLIHSIQTKMMGENTLSLIHI